jgi:hypothetical protein
MNNTPPMTAEEVVGGTGDSQSQGCVPQAKNMFPGLRMNTGRPTKGVGEAREVIELLSAAGIPACVIGVHALRYYGAGRISWVSLNRASGFRWDFYDGILNTSLRNGISVSRTINLKMQSISSLRMINTSPLSRLLRCWYPYATFALSLS